LPIKTEIIDDADGVFQNKLLQLLIAENTRNAGETTVERTIIRLYDSDNRATEGGIWTEILFDWMYIEVLYVPEPMRGCGFGSNLLRQVEEIAASRGCVGVWLETFEFQAPDFYLKNGYEIFATLDNYPIGSKRQFLRKVFDSGSSGVQAIA